MKLMNLEVITFITGFYLLGIFHTLTNHALQIMITAVQSSQNCFNLWHRPQITFGGEVHFDNSIIY